MDTIVLDKLISLIESFEKKTSYEYDTQEVKSISNEFALAKTDEEIIDYLNMMDKDLTPYDFRLLMIGIYESV